MHYHRPLIAIALIVFLTGIHATTRAAVAARQLYVSNAATCDGLPRLQIDMAPGYCAGLIHGPSKASFRNRSIKTPRMLLPLASGRSWVVSDLGEWTAGRGALWLVEVESKKPAHLTKLIDGLSLPHTVALGPDGWIYVGEMSRIFRFDFAAADPAKTIEVVVSGLPDNKLHENRHPLTHFIFDKQGDLLINVGAPTDQCAPEVGESLTSVCLGSDGDDAKAVIRRYSYLGNGHWDSNPSVVARGLRNSLVLVQHKSGTILQGENSFDFSPESDRPYDEINVIRAGYHYGWPYCADLDQPTPVWAITRAMDCTSPTHEKPIVLLPPHAAPLGAVYYEGSMFPELTGNLLMTWHGHRPTGSRLVAFKVDVNGVPVLNPNSHYPEYTEDGVAFKPYDGPAAEPKVLTPGWDLQRGARPAGAPVGLAIARDGAIWVADDRNATILRISVDRP